MPMLIYAGATYHPFKNSLGSEAMSGLIPVSVCAIASKEVGLGGYLHQYLFGDSLSGKALL